MVEHRGRQCSRVADQPDRRRQLPAQLAFLWCSLSALFTTTMSASSSTPLLDALHRSPVRAKVSNTNVADHVGHRDSTGLTRRFRSGSHQKPVASNSTNVSGTVTPLQRLPDVGDVCSRTASRAIRVLSSRIDPPVWVDDGRPPALPPDASRSIRCMPSASMAVDCSTLTSVMPTRWAFLESGSNRSSSVAPAHDGRGGSTDQCDGPWQRCTVTLAQWPSPTP